MRFPPAVPRGAAGGFFGEGWPVVGERVLARVALAVLLGLLGASSGVRS